MRATLRSANDRLRQLEKYNVGLAANYAELEDLREMVREQQNKAKLRAKHRLSTRSVKPSIGFRTAG
jgi:hypothetical protein